MKKVITYGTFDVFHQGHLNLLKNAKNLGDYLIVGVTTQQYDQYRGKLNISDNLMKRIENVKATGLADEIIIEEYEGQKIEDIQSHGVDIFAIGSDWVGKFDYLKDYCDVVYLPRTKGVSSTLIREKMSGSILRIGIVGCGRIAHRFIPESKYVSGIEVVGVYKPDKKGAEEFAKTHELSFATADLNEFIKNIDVAYIASPHLSHMQYARYFLENGIHVLCEKPISFDHKMLAELYTYAQSQKLVLMEAVKTAYCPGFNRLISLVKSGIIGSVKDVTGSFTKLSSGNLRELDPVRAGGSMFELGTYPLLPIIKLFGPKPEDMSFVSMKSDTGVDLYTTGNIIYKNGIGHFKVGLGVKTEGELIISGTKGYLHVPAPWWKTEYFEIRHEDTNNVQKYFYKFEGDGLRYELSELVTLVRSKSLTTHKYLPAESIAIASVMESFSRGECVTEII